MKTTHIIAQKTESTASGCLESDIVKPDDPLEAIRRARAGAGDELEDIEFNFLMRERHLPAEAGFHFLCLYQGFVTMSVPLQDYNSWYPAGRWISDEKEAVATRIAKKYELMLAEPPNVVRRGFIPYGMPIRHHLLLCNRKETVIVAHPQFLKIRLYASDTNLVLPPKPGLLKELAAIYQTNLLGDLAVHLRNG